MDKIIADIEECLDPNPGLLRLITDIFERIINSEKSFILEKIKSEKRDLMPNEVRNLLNEYRQKV